MLDGANVEVIAVLELMGELDAVAGDELENWLDDAPDKLWLEDGLKLELATGVDEEGASEEIRPLDDRTAELSTKEDGAISEAVEDDVSMLLSSADEISGTLELVRTVDELAGTVELGRIADELADAIELIRIVDELAGAIALLLNPAELELVLSSLLV